MSKPASGFEQDFQDFFADRSTEMVALAALVRGSREGAACFTRPLLRSLLCSATDLEEILDAYGAPHNLRWYRMRRLMASVKLFSAVAYNLRHLILFLPTYRLQEVEGDFEEATHRAIGAVCRILRGCLLALTEEAESLALTDNEQAVPESATAERMPSGHLQNNRPSHKVASPERTVTRVATAFLNLAEDGKFIHLGRSDHPERYADWIPEPVSEDRLRTLEQAFHNLQALYDTHISDTDVESLDSDLPVLRGHVSVIFHLLEIATALTHYTERHILSFVPRNPATKDRPSEAAPGAEVAGAEVAGAEVVSTEQPLVDHAEVLEVLMSYALAFASRYMLKTRGLCHEMLKRYAIQGRITVSVPRYRGFHVRPSTLVAKIVSHYGSEVTMTLDRETYNAGYTLDLFRANEKINAIKKRLLAREVQRCYPDEGLGEQGPELAVRKVAHQLFAEGKLVLYDRSLSPDGITPKDNETPQEVIYRALTKLLASGKIDVEMDITVSFYGDRRVLNDIKLLADSGYGEDDFGNNLPLPDELAYLRK